MDVSQLTPRRPYLLRAFYDWLLDNQLTPHLVVDVTLPGVLVPMEYARDGQIVLNIAPRAVGNLELANDEVRFNARFGGVPRNVSVPLAAVLAIYARENGAGTMFEPEAAYDEDVSSLNDDDVAPLEKSAGCAVAQLIDLVVDGGILLDICVRGRDVSLRLVVVIVGDKVFHRILREKFFKLTVKLCCQCLIMR